MNSDTEGVRAFPDGVTPEDSLSPIERRITLMYHGTTHVRWMRWVLSYTFLIAAYAAGLSYFLTEMGLLLPVTTTIRDISLVWSGLIPVVILLLSGEIVALRVLYNWYVRGD